MEFVDLQVEIRTLEAAGDLQKLSVLLELLASFPDLRAVKDRWGRLKYCSKSANEETDCIELAPNAHDCDGKPLEVWPYIVIDKVGTKLFADPPYYLVADQNTAGFGETPRQGWRELLEAAGLGRSAILKVKDYLARHPPVDYSED